jgi:guanosine-3',5'-bis(diphosphate) 3'-pyrophosphohydrolase
MSTDFSTYHILKAANFAAIKHQNQRRKNPLQTPYINHPIGVAMYLSECGVTDTDVLSAAILHDTVEDTDTSLEELATLFGTKIAGLVSTVSDDKTLVKAERKRLQVIHARESSSETKLIKMADKMHNLTDLTKIQPTGWDEKRVQGYFVWSKAVIDGCRGTNEMLENMLDKLFDGKFMLNGESYDCIPKNVDLSLFLEDYYTDMVEAGKVEDD